MERVRYFEDYIMEETRETFGRTITETDFVVHAGHTGDFFPHHLDEEFCKTKPWKKRIAHGTMTFAIGIGLTATEINPVAFTYGYERLRFPAPVYIGDTIRSRIRISKKIEDPKRAGFGQVTETVEVLNQDEKVVLFCEHILLVEMRNS
ncbi:dehydratase [Vibrio nigripulchritudo ATCC 27043]|uniref:Acyl dehydratase n=2 Tax=Vibrio nigripulchritudo TaxID=28173 RepID=A0AAV2VZU2_9VIBR|nr:MULTISPECIES: MaoC/PaaZ C-terminal domain-containing protein [Vibrio]EGU61296.1 dehydratase [Vibrio nigripulchritudo ATCC 27043]KJY75923.1 dehydratase [Vibrio nigripulchritudo]UAB71688.1 dehydratase [Vibrio sp. SCSIO 43132]CCN34285.1 putative Acyl dehydratase [Vibrio nigripulchritudo AM115]CCN43891.1 putative Acyl dehydratase [Vibrio nigripulchritudo FTn2]